MGKRFSACFVLKFALQRGEGVKREEVQISKSNTGTFPAFQLSAELLSKKYHPHTKDLRGAVGTSREEEKP